MITTLRQRNFALLWFAGLISMIGDWVLFIALPIYTYNLTNSSLATGIMFMAGTLAARPVRLIGRGVCRPLGPPAYDGHCRCIVGGAIVILAAGAVRRIDLDHLYHRFFTSDNFTVLWASRECFASPVSG